MQVMVFMWKRFKNWVHWLMHPLPQSLREFRQVIAVNGFEFHLMPAQYTDVEEMVVLERAAYNGEEPWSEDIFHNELHRSRERLYVVVREPETGTMVAYIGAAFRPGIHEVHITNVTVTPHWQGRGLGTFLLMYMMAVAKQIRFHRVSLEVRVSNVSAQRLYERLGFQTVRRKTNYYGDNGEDAFDMAQILGRKSDGFYIQG